MINSIISKSKSIFYIPNSIINTNKYLHNKIIFNNSSSKQSDLEKISKSPNKIDNFIP